MVVATTPTLTQSHCAWSQYILILPSEDQEVGREDASESAASADQCAFLGTSQLLVKDAIQQAEMGTSAPICTGLLRSQMPKQDTLRLNASYYHSSAV